MVVFISLTYFGGIPVYTPVCNPGMWLMVGSDKPVIPGQHCVQLVSPPQEEINLFGTPAWVYVQDEPEWLWFYIYMYKQCIH